MREYGWLDAAKFCFALCVVALHVYLKDLDAVQRFVFNGAVPFFFLVSGFLLSEKIWDSGGRYVGDAVFKHVLGKSLKRYLWWMLAYVPLSVLEFLHDDKPWFFDVAIYIRGFLVIGETPWSWPLWYLHAYVVAVLLIWMLLRKGFSFKKVCLIGCILLLAGCLWNSDYASFTPLLGKMHRVYSLVFGTTRNGLFQALAYVSCGMLVGRYGISKARCAAIIPFLLIPAGAAVSCVGTFMEPVAALLFGGGYFSVTHAFISL